MRPKELLIRRLKSIGGWTIKEVSQFPNLILYFIFLLILVVCSISIIQAYLNLNISNHLVLLELDQIRTNIDLLFKSPEGGLIPPLQTDMYMRCLQEKSANEFRLNTTDFLFQLFSVALISVGVYLLNRSQDNHKKIKRIISSYHWYTKSFSLVQILDSIVMHLYIIGNIAKNEDPGRSKLMVSAMITDMRSWIDHDLMELAKQIHSSSPIIISIYQKKYFHDVFTTIKGNLKDIQVKYDVNLEGQMEAFEKFCDVFWTSVKEKSFDDEEDSIELLEFES